MLVANPPLFSLALMLQSQLPTLALPLMSENVPEWTRQVPARLACEAKARRSGRGVLTGFCRGTPFARSLSFGDGWSLSVGVGLSGAIIGGRHREALVLIL